MPRPLRRQRGAALLLAMLVLTLVATLAAAMTWHQQRAIEVEAAERARTQAAWILDGALDWARLILREDARGSGSVDHLGEPWAVPLAEARLSTFLASDRQADSDDGPEAFLSGAIVDAQSRYNLRNLVGSDGKPAPLEAAAFKRLADAIGLEAVVADQLIDGLRAALVGDADESTPLAPRRVADLRWLGLDGEALARLQPFVVLLPTATPVNLNTAAREVVLAAIDGIDLGSAERIVQARQRGPLRNADEVKALLPEGVKLDDKRAAVGSRHFEVQGRLRLEDRVLEQRSLVERRGNEVVTLQRETLSPLPQAGR
jgi:general secretion pathway protein K